MANRGRPLGQATVVSGGHTKAPRPVGRGAQVAGTGWPAGYAGRPGRALRRRVDPGADGVDRGLRPVRHAQLLDHALDDVLDRADAVVHLARYLLVRQSADQEVEHLLLTRGERLQRALHALEAASLHAHLLQELAEQARVDEGAASLDEAYGVDQALA